MKTPVFSFSDLWRWDGLMGRRKYFCLGVILALVKYGLDRVVVEALFHRIWLPSDYLFFRYWNDPLEDSPAMLYPALLAMALPFVWTGVVMTIRRLRTVGLPLGTVMLFFMPGVNLILFAVLCLAPEDAAAVGAESHDRGLARKFGVAISKSRWGSAAAAVMVVVFIGLIGTAFSTSLVQSYGMGLFVGMPFCLGMIAVFVHGYATPRSYVQSIVVCLSAVAIVGFSLVAFAFEGAVCLIMAAPLAAVLALMGGTVAHMILRTSYWNRRPDQLICSTILLIPTLIGFEHLGHWEAPLLCVKTSVEINAPPRTVWRRVVSFQELPEPTEWLFKAGIAYPVRADITGHGVGAVRKCRFSTGPFVEPIEVWDEPRLLKFAVTENPAPLQEWSPYREIHPPHLHGFLMSEAGQFKLIENRNGTTLLEGTTWYRHNMWPASYWQIWSDFIIHTIHLRVLNHVKNLSESG